MVYCARDGMPISVVVRKPCGGAVEYKNTFEVLSSSSFLNTTPKLHHRAPPLSPLQSSTKWQQMRLTAWRETGRCRRRSSSRCWISTSSGTTPQRRTRERAARSRRSATSTAVTPARCCPALPRSRRISPSASPFPARNMWPRSSADKVGSTRCDLRCMHELELSSRESVLLTNTALFVRTKQLRFYDFLPVFLSVQVARSRH